MIRPFPNPAALPGALPGALLGALLGALVFAACGGAASTSAGGSPSVAPPDQASPEQAAPAPVTVLAGVYTDEQAERGRLVFREACAECHTTRDFRGETFYLSWEGSTVGRFVTSLVDTMPDDDPGSLPMQHYLDVTAYVLQLNGMPTGAAELADRAETLAGIRIERVGEGEGG
jgi:mono/diheme cytochrome c family protein